MLIFTKNAISNINEFINSNRTYTKQNAKKYMKNLINFIQIIDDMNYIGKNIIYNFEGYNLKQIIYNNHRIIYFLADGNVIILAILHVKLDLKKALKKLQNEDLF